MEVTEHSTHSMESRKEVQMLIFRAGTEMWMQRMDMWTWWGQGDWDKLRKWN